MDAGILRAVEWRDRCHDGPPDVHQRAGPLGRIPRGLGREARITQGADDPVAHPRFPFRSCRMSSAASTSSAASLASSPASVYRLWVRLPVPWWLGARPLPNHGLDERVGRFVFILAETWVFLRHGGKLRVGRVGSTGLGSPLQRWRDYRAPIGERDDVVHQVSWPVVRVARHALEPILGRAGPRKPPTRVTPLLVREGAVILPRPRWVNSRRSRGRA
jgi:hypothetical protein